MAGYIVNSHQLLRSTLPALFLWLLLASAVEAAAPNLPPELLAQLRNMSPAEQKSFAKRYGLDLEELLVVNQASDLGETLLGAPGEPLRQIELLDSMIEDPLGEQEGDERDEEEPLKRFGSSLFDSKVSTFSPVDNIPVPEGYILGVGDQLRVVLIGKEQGDIPLLVDRDGSITLPKLGRLVLSGLTFQQAKQLVEKRVSEQLIGSEAILSMGPLRSINVFMAGEVKSPGNYSMSGLTTLSQSIFIAGGIADTGSYRSVQLKRKGKIIQSFDIYDLLLSGDSSRDMRLQSGDVVFVPVAGPQMAVFGEVVRPAIYEFNDGDTVGDLLSMAGGALATGDPRQALLKRFVVGTSLPSITNLNLLESESLNVRAIDGDELSVRAMSQRISNPIAIEGDTELKGLIGWKDGLKIADVFKNLESDVEPTADLNTSLLVRRKNSLNDISVSAISLAEAVLRPDSRANMELKPFDRIVVLPQPAANRDSVVGLEDESEEEDENEEELEFENQEEEISRLSLISPIVEALERQAGSGERAKVVRVSGAVREPGLYPLLGSGAIAEVISLAGGYTDAAYLERVEVRRIQINESQEAEVEILNLNLNDASVGSFDLIGRDTLRINSIPNWSTNDTVELSGEFLFPGVYTIFEGETISNLIKRAGGFTNDAFLNGAQYFSSAAKASQAMQLKKISDAMARRLASRESSIGVVEPNQSESLESAFDEELLGRVVIDLPGIVDGVEGVNAVVDDGDRLFVPKYTNTIAVVGEVYEPGTFKYQRGLSLEQYLEIAGGTTDYALKRSTYILKADGSVRFFRQNRLRNIFKFNLTSEEAIEAGDAIVVPANLDYESPLNRVNAITGVIFQSFTSIAALLSITNQ